MEISPEERRQLIQEKYAGDEQAPGLIADLARLAGGEPLAYIIGTQPFLGLSLSLSSKPLIPRPETEWWTENLITDLNKTKDAIRILDLCAGSGAIGLAVLKHVPHAHVSFVEIDEAHAALIRKNIEQNYLDVSRAEVFAGDLFAPVAHGIFDVIVTNPPYIPEGRILPESVTDFEPHQALFAGPDGLSLIRRIAMDAPKHLSTKGSLWLECDSEHAEEVRNLLIAGGAQRADIHTDQYGRPRLVLAWYYHEPE